jgi:hypothetical protein
MAGAMLRALLAVYALLLVGCLNETALIEKFTPKEDDEFARRFVDLLREGRVDEASLMLDPDVAAKAGVGELNKLHQILDHGKPSAFEIIGSNAGYFALIDGSGRKRQTNLVYQLQFQDTWVVATIVVESTPQKRQILSAHLQPVSDSLQVLNRFTLSNKSVVHYLVLGACILIPLFIIMTVVICFRARVRRRWLWIFVILIGFVQFRLNWTTGAWEALPVSFNLLGAGWFRASSYAPVILNFALPLGAILFLICRPRLRRKDEPPPLPSEITSDPSKAV